MVLESCNFLLADVEKRRTLFDRKGKFEIFQWRLKSVKWRIAETLVRVVSLCSSSVRGAERRMLATTAGSGVIEQALSALSTAPTVLGPERDQGPTSTSRGPLPHRTLALSALKGAVGA